MPLTDGYGQNIPYPTLTDKPNAQSLGQGIVEAVTPKLVMSFPSATTRGATIKAPAQGMVTWLRDVKRLDVFDGAGWSTVAGGASPWKNITLVTGFTGNGNSQGTPQYRIVNLFGEQTIMFRGGFTINYSSGSIPNNSVINAFPLPVEARPASGVLRTIPVACSASSSDVATVKLDIKNNGDLSIVGTNAVNKPPWVSLNGAFCSL